MDITIYGTKSCGVCKMIKKRLEEAKINFFYIDDEETTMSYAQKVGITSVPLIEIDGEIYDTISAVKKLGL